MDICQEAVFDPAIFGTLYLQPCPTFPQTYTDDQLKILAAIRDHRRVVVHSAHGTGKSRTAADVVIWFLESFAPAKVITTATTWAQVKDVLWSEIRQRHSTALVSLASKLQPASPDLRVGPDHFATGISTDDGVRFQGRHSPNMLVVLDECAGIPGDIWSAAANLCTGENNRILAIGNPETPAGPFYDRCKSSEWKTIHVDGFNHPNVTSGRELIPGAITSGWVKEKADEYGGEDKPLFKARVRGQFPTEGVDTLIPLSWVQAAQKRTVRDGDTRIYIACDPARYGDDETVICVLEGSRQIEQEVHQGNDLMASTGLVQRVYRRFAERNPIVVIDDVGLGSGMTDRLREEGIPVMAFNGALSPDYKILSKDLRYERYRNLRCMAWWLLRVAFQNEAISILEDDKLESQLVVLTYAINSTGLLEVETKKQLKERLGTHGASPDRADALVMAWWARLHHLTRRRSTDTKRQRFHANRSVEARFKDLGMPTGRFTGYK